MSVILKPTKIKYKDPDTGEYTGIANAIGDEATADAIDNWLDNHPEATTTVQDGAVTKAKLGFGITDFLPIELNNKTFTKDGKETIVYYSIIPKQYKPSLGMANDMVDTVVENEVFAGEHCATISINAGRFRNISEPYGETLGFLVVNGEVINDSPFNDSENRSSTLYMDQNGFLNSLSIESTLQDLLSHDPVWAVQGFTSFVENGVYTGSTSKSTNPCSFIGQDAAGNYIIGCCSGRDVNDEGLSISDIYDFVIQDAGFTPRFMYNLDGGGSSSIIYKNVRVNSLTNGENRKVANFIYWSDDNIKLEDTFSTYLQERQIIKLLADVYNIKFAGNFSKSGYDDVSEVRESCVLLCNEDTTGFPIDNYGYLVTLCGSNTRTSIQFAVNNTYLYYREVYFSGSNYTPDPGDWVSIIGTPQRTTATSSYGSCDYTVSGEIVDCFIDFSFSSSVSLPAQTMIASGFPKPFYHSCQVVGLLVDPTDDSYIPIGLNLTTDGNLINKRAINPSHTTYLRLNFTYIKQ